jgi:hypothetical protein
MIYRMRTAALLAACTIVAGLLSETARADQVRYQCLDNQLLRVRVELVAQGAAQGRLGLVPRLHHHHRQLPLESLLTCFGVSKPKGAA